MNGITAYERVYTGTRLIFEGAEPDGDEEEASVALILWSDGDEGRPLVAELSFRLEDKKERFSRGLSRSARSFYEGVQRLDRARPEGRTKTEFIYRDRTGIEGAMSPTHHGLLFWAILGMSLSPAHADGPPRPQIRKLGTLDLDMVEATPVVFRDRAVSLRVAGSTERGDRRGLRARSGRVPSWLASLVARPGILRAASIRQARRAG